ncbi:hypothetical protein FACS1894104_5330 [Actinomycetota bacterium]|nr:hypothetical protein FACS1894104_5330 [Actinomycetota bacterium]
MPLTDKDTWHGQKADAAAAFERARRRRLDKEIIDEIKNATVAYDVGDDQLSRAYADILIVIIELCSDTAGLYAAVSTIARRAKRSERRVSSFLKWAEAEKILIRKSSGGINLLTGEKKANHYGVRYDRIREFLGLNEVSGIKDLIAFNSFRLTLGLEPIANGERYREYEVANAIYNTTLLGHTRCAWWSDEWLRRTSSRPRGQRRKEYRARMGITLKLGAVENSAQKAAVKVVEKIENQASEQGFCRLTLLKYLKEHRKISEKNKSTVNLENLGIPKLHSEDTVDYLIKYLESRNDISNKCFAPASPALFNKLKIKSKERKEK